VLRRWRACWPAENQAIGRIRVSAVGQFLNDLSRVDLIIELVQNELDAGSRHTVIAFEEDALVCEGDGTAD
jgi:hypothetical protein